LRVILHAITEYNRLRTLVEATVTVSHKYGIAVSRQNVKNWLTSFREYLPVARLRPRTWTAATLPNGLCRRWRLAGTHCASWFARHEAVTSAAPVHPQQEGLKFLLDAQSQGTLTAAGRRLDLPPFTVLA
jgi:hypothetical protein